MVDVYTKAVLTVIAVALSVFAVDLSVLAAGLPYREYDFNSAMEGRVGEFLPTTLGESVQAAIDDPSLRPTEVAIDAFQQNEVLPSPLFGEQINPPDPRDNEMMSPEEVKEQYGHLGVKFDRDVTRHKARFTAVGKLAERNRASIVDRGPGGFAAGALRFGAGAVGSLFDPIALAGYLVAGIAIRKIWAALSVAAAWAFIMEVVVTLLANSSQLNYAFGENLLERMFGALLSTGLVFSIAHLTRGDGGRTVRKTAKPKRKPTAAIR